MPEIRTIHRPEELDEVFAASHRAPAWVLKHSLTCGTSVRALGEYRRYAESRPSGSPDLFHLIEVQNARTLSRELAARTGVRHESPQALLLAAGEVAWHASHHRVREAALAEAAAAATAGTVG